MLFTSVSVLLSGYENRVTIRIVESKRDKFIPMRLFGRIIPAKWRRDTKRKFQ
jgi:hypothetical protein